MSAKFLAVGAVVGGIVLFLWGGFTHAVLPAPMREFKDEQAVVQAIRANIPENGVYFAKRGMLAAIAFRPDLADKSQDIKGNLITQLVTDTIAAFLLCLVLMGIRAGTPLGRAGWLTLIGLAIVALKLLPYWNWYGFTPAFIGMEALDVVRKFFIGGLLLAWLHKKMAPA